MELEVGIYTDDEDILAVRLKRINNKTDEYYILVPGPVPLGTSRDLPISVIGAPPFTAGLYFNPLDHAWCFRPLQGFSKTTSDVSLRGPKDFAFGKIKCQFAPQA